MSLHCVRFSSDTKKLFSAACPCIVSGFYNDTKKLLSVAYPCIVSGFRITLARPCMLHVLALCQVFEWHKQVFVCCMPLHCVRFSSDTEKLLSAACPCIVSDFLLTQASLCLSPALALCHGLYVWQWPEQGIVCRTCLESLDWGRQSQSPTSGS